VYTLLYERCVLAYSMSSQLGLPNSRSLFSPRGLFRHQAEGLLTAPSCTHDVWLPVPIGRCMFVQILLKNTVALVYSFDLNVHMHEILYSGRRKFKPRRKFKLLHFHNEFEALRIMIGPPNFNNLHNR
jgi:hypothetical protein